VTRPAPAFAGGFTLIELVVVLLVLGLALGLVAPSVSHVSDSIRARAEVAGLSAFLRHAREEAILRRERCEVRLDPATQVLTLTTGDQQAVKASRAIRPPARIASITPGAGTIAFLPEGHSTGGGFVLEAPGGRVYSVTVDPVSGRVSNYLLAS